MTEPLKTYTIPQLAEVTGRSTKTIRKAIVRKRLVAVPIGGRYEMTMEAYNDWVSGKTEQVPEPPVAYPVIKNGRKRGRPVKRMF